MELTLRDGRWVAAGAAVTPRPRRVRLLEWLLPWAARLRGGYFRYGVERPVCRAIHGAAARGTLYRFAPPPPLTLVRRGRGRWRADEYRFRSPFVSHIAPRNQAYLRHYRSGPRARGIVILNHGSGCFAAFLEGEFIARLLTAGLDVALLAAPGFYRRRHRHDLRRQWAATVGAALSAMVQLVHDDVAVEAWARGLGYRVVAVSGIGIGGTVAAVAASTSARFDACVPMLAGAHPGRLWLPPRILARAVHRRALARAGVRRGRTLARLFDPVAPARFARPQGRRPCTVVGLRADTLVLAADVADLAAHWRVVPVWLPRCHVELPACTGDLAAIVARTVLRAA